MSNSTVTTLIVLESAGLLLTVGMLGGAIYLGLKARKKAKAMAEKYEQVKREFADFTTRLQRIL